MKKSFSDSKFIKVTSKFFHKAGYLISNPGKSGRLIRIAFTSVAFFACGAIITSGILVSINTNKERTAQGGLETDYIPEIKDDVFSIIEDQSLADDVDFIVDNGDVAEVLTQEQIEEAMNESIAPLTYQTYRVKKGDMIGFIADSFGITQDTIISINNIKQSRLIQIGQYLKIPSMPGILYTTKGKGETPTTIAEKYEVDAEKCALVNSVSVDTELAAGISFFVPDAQLDWATRQEINGDLFRKPLRAKYWLSSPYGWRNSPFGTGKRSFHGGIDMACSSGTPIYPAMDGKVTAAGYNATYGNYVIVTHHSGYKTLYGHMSKITCKAGNFVYTNTQIGKVGSTGLSTGPHLHFTVYKNGKTVNPLSLIN